MGRCLPGLVLRHPPWLLDKYLTVKEIPYEAPHQMRPNPVLRWVTAPPMTAAQNCHTRKKALCSACMCWSFSPRSRRAKTLSCSHPQNARMPISWSSVGMTTSWSAMQLRKAPYQFALSVAAGKYSHGHAVSEGEGGCKKRL